MTDALPPEYMHSGPRFPGESIHQAMGENTAASLSAHMIRRASQHVAHTAPSGSSHADAVASVRATLRPDASPSSDLEPMSSPYDHEAALDQDPHEYYEPVAARLRSGGSTGNATSRAPQSPRTRRGPGSPSRP